MTKKIFAIVLTVSVLGALLGGCGKSDDASGASTTGTTGTTK